MLTDKQKYQGVLQRLDKFGSAAVDLEDFNYHMNEAMRRVVDGLIPLSEKDREAAQDLQVLEQRYVATSAPAAGELPLTGNSAPLPDGWLSIRNCLVTFTALADGAAPYGQIFETSAEPVTPDREASFSRPGGNYYNKPKVRRPYFRIGGNRIEVLFGADLGYALGRIEGRYYKRPRQVNLQPGNDADGIDPASNLASEFSDEFDRKLIVACATDLMLRFGDERTSASASIDA